MADRLEMMRDDWNKRMTLQCSTHLHSHMQLEQAKNVLEVAAGAGLGSLDAVQYLLAGRSELPKDTKRVFTATDLAPVMVGLAEQNLSGAGSEAVEVKCKVANGQDLAEVATGSMDHYIASLCLQLALDPDALLREANRVLTADGVPAANKELGFEEDTGEHSNFRLGKDPPALRQRFAAAGFQRVQIWPFQCVVELWSGEAFATFQQEEHPLEDEELSAKRFAVVKHMADEWLATGAPIDLEAYIILTRK